ncbi:MAG TPA: carboxypeptidase regulatory-like domain-containing protein [Bryobacteraceae bacterium]|nr:carboxypeptidase regulatory-like domain-containing protein [Bryobacteraceae bacterium]
MSVKLRALLIVSIAVATMAAQTFQGQISGLVRDKTGGVIPKVQLTVVDANSGAKFTAVTNESGVYRFPSLPPSQYQVSATLTGFKTFSQGPITIQVNQSYDLDITLEPGQVSETVQVSSEAPPLETASSTLGQVVTTRSILSLPLNIRDPFALVGLTPGVTFGGNFGNGGGKDVGRNFFKSDFNVGGGRSGSQEILLDGAPNTTPDINRGVINPPVDSVQEFKVQVSSYDAEFGRTSGGVINMVTKAGTNSYHGVAYDFERHSNLDANEFFNNRAGRPLTSFARHQFGGNIGGPILKNKWFLFGDYEGLRQGYPNSIISTVPSQLQRQGNFSQTLASNRALITLYDPDTLTTLADGSRQRTPFAGNIIPGNRFDNVASKTVPFYPLPNIGGDPVTGQNNYFFGSKAITNSDKYDIRSDVNLSESTRFFVRYSRQEDDRIAPGNMPLPIGGGRQTTDHYTQGVADLTHVFSPSLVGDAQFSATRGLATQYGMSQGFDVSQLGFVPSFTSQVVSQFPVFAISDVSGTSNLNDNFLQFQPRNVFNARGSLSYLRGKHGLKFGGEYRWLHFNEGQLNNPTGAFTFNRGYTQGPNPVQASPTAGFGFASFLLGDVASGLINRLNPISTQSRYAAGFVQDDWRVSSRLTLNLGVRWEMSSGDMEKWNRLAYFDPFATNPLGAKAGLPNLKGQLVWIGHGNGNQQETTNNFGPRAGFAYQITSKTVLRGGYGIFFLPRNVQGNGSGAVEAFRTTTMLATIDGLTPANRLTNPYPTGIQPAQNSRDPLANAGSTISVPTHEYQNPYAQTWSLGIQRELPGKLVLDVHYWGGKDTRLLTTWNINQLPDEYLALGNRLNDQVPNPFFGAITTGALTSSTISRRQSLLPFPQYSGDNGVARVFTPAANSTYQAGTIQVERRLSGTFTFLAAYTRSKAIDDVRNPLDYYNRRLEKSLSAFHAPNQFVLSSVYELPFGRGRAVGSTWGKPADAVLGGWQLSGIVRVQSGFPVSVGRIVNNGRSARLDNPTIDRWFDTAVFANVPAFTYGNTGPFLPDVRTDGLRNVDAVMSKSFSISVKDHKITTQFRAEFYNLFNHPQFAAPNGTVSSQSFGQVTNVANAPRDIQFGLKIGF